MQHRTYVLWKLRQNISASFTLWVGRTLNSNLEHAIVAPGTCRIGLVHGARRAARHRLADSIDAVLLLKTYHEVAHPLVLLRNLRSSLKAGAKIGTF